jgi:hypothetical protein
MISEWMKVMLEEISRKQAEHEEACIEERRRGHDEAELKRAPRRNADGRTGQ